MNRKLHPTIEKTKLTDESTYVTVLFILKFKNCEKSYTAFSAGFDNRTYNDDKL